MKLSKLLLFSYYFVKVLVAVLYLNKNSVIFNNSRRSYRIKVSVFNVLMGMLHIWQVFRGIYKQYRNNMISYS